MRRKSGKRRTGVPWIFCLFSCASILHACTYKYYLYDVESYRGLTDSLEGSSTIVTQRPPSSEEASLSKARYIEANSIIVERDGIRIQSMPAGQYANSDEVIFAILVSNSSNTGIEVVESSFALAHSVFGSGERMRKPREVGFATGVGINSPTVSAMDIIPQGATKSVIARFEKERVKKPMKLVFTVQDAKGTYYTYEFSFSGLEPE